ncbi:MAG: metallopeptidase TldD-related protein [Acidobacteriota bacterium]
MNRRELLGTLGAASASTLLWAFGCRAPVKGVEHVAASGGEVRTWLHDAIAALRGAGLDAPHALAVTRRRTTAAIDVLGAGVSRGRSDGVVIGVRDKDGAAREIVTSELSADGVADAVQTLIGRALGAPARLDFGKPRVWNAAGVDLDDDVLLARVETMAQQDDAVSSRIVYQAASIDIDDATVWSVAPGSDLEQRLVRVRRGAIRVAWNGTRPVVSEVARAWMGGIDDGELTGHQLGDATRAALQLLTPGSLDDGEYGLVLEPSIVAAIVDAATQALLTVAAARRPEVARRLAIGANVASPQLTLVDDPTAPRAYGGFHFDDAGELAAPVTLLDQGHVAQKLARARRPGHLGVAEPAASHLRLAAGASERDHLLDDGYLLEGASSAVVDPASDRLVVAIARAREVKGGKLTGRVFADLELVGDLAALLASVHGVSKQTDTLAIRDDRDGRPCWRSFEVPSLRVRGNLRAHRSQT